MIEILMIVGVAVAFATLIGLLNIRMVEGDEHYGHIGFGAVQQSGADVFSTAMIDKIIEPDIIIKDVERFKKTLAFDIDEILVWDLREWLAHMNSGFDVTGSEDSSQVYTGGVTVDNSKDGTDAPTAASVLEGVRPGGRIAATVGTAGLDFQQRTAGEEVPRFEAFFEFGGVGNEQQDATGQINYSGIQRWPLNDQKKAEYRVDGISVHKLLTGAHYHLYADTTGGSTARVLSLGGDVRKMSVDLQEVMFDRATVFSLLEALFIAN